MLSRRRHDSRGTAAAVLLLGVALVVAAAIVSLFWWRSDSDACTCEWCPDRYCEYGEAIRSAVAGDCGGWTRLAAFGREYVHAHSPLAPALMSAPMLAGIEPVPAFGIVSALATLAAWLAVRRAIVLAFDPEPLVRGLVFALFFTNALVVRSFVRPMTDAVGIACTAWSLYLLQRELDRRSLAGAVRLVAAQSIGLFSRVSFIPMLALPALAALIAPSGTRRDRLLASARAGLLYGALPAALFLAATTALGIENLRAAWGFAHQPQFVHELALRAWRSSLWLAGGPLLVVAAAGAFAGGWNSAAWRVQALWVPLYLGFLALGQGAPFPRYFVPIVPAVAIAATPALSRIAKRSTIAAVLVGVAILLPGLRSMQRIVGHRASSLALVAEGVREGAWIEPLPHARERRIDAHQTTVKSLDRPVPEGPADAGAHDAGPGDEVTVVQIDLTPPRRVRALAFSIEGNPGLGEFAIEGTADGSTWLSLADRSSRSRAFGFFAMFPGTIVDLRPAGRLRALRLRALDGDPARWRVHSVELYRPAGSSHRERVPPNPRS